MLHDFDNKIFRGSHDPILVDEDKRLKSLNNQTKTWYKCMNTIETASGQVEHGMFLLECNLMCMMTHLLTDDQLFNVEYLLMNVG